LAKGVGDLNAAKDKLANAKGKDAVNKAKQGLKDATEAVKTHAKALDQLVTNIKKGQ
jgi:hypothetical protein